MAVIKYDELFDFPGYQKAIKDAESANKEFGTVVSDINARIAKQYKEISADLKEYSNVLKSFNVNQKGAADAITKTGEAGVSTAKKLAEQKRIMNDLVGATDLTTKSTNELKIAGKALESEWSSLGGRSDDVRAKKQLLAAEFKRVTEEAKRQSAELKSTTTVIKSAEGSYNALQAELKQIGTQLKGMPNAFDSVTGKINKNNKEAVAMSARYLEINNVLKKADAQLGNFQRNVGNYSSAFKGISESLKHAGEEILGLIGITSIGAFFSNSVDAALELDKTIRLLQNTLKNVGVPELFERIEHKTKDLMNQFKFLDEADITQVFNKLVVYGKLTEKQMNDLLPVIINFATATGQTLPEATATVIKGLEGNGRALKEYGINMKDAKNVTEGYSLIMKELKPRVEGVAEAFGKSAEGQIAETKEEFKQLKEEVGNGLIPILVALLKVASTVLTALKGVFNEVAGNANHTKESIESLLQVDEVQKLAASQKQFFVDELQSQLAQRKKLISEGKKFEEKTNEELVESYIKGLEKSKAQEDAFLKKNAAGFLFRTKEVQDQIKSAVALSSGLQQAIDELSASSKVIGPGDPNTVKGGKSAEELFAEKIKKGQELLKAELEKRTALFELANETELINEGEFQSQKLALIQKFTEAAIALENKKSKPDPKVIADFNKQRIDAEIVYQKFETKADADTLEQRKASIKDAADAQISAIKDEHVLVLATKKLTDQEKLALELDYQNRVDDILIDSLDRRIKLETDASKKAALEREKEELERNKTSRNTEFDNATLKKSLQDKVDAHHRAFEAIRAMRNTSFRDEVDNIKALQKIYEEAAKKGVDVTKEKLEAEHALKVLYADRDKQLREELDKTLIQGLQAGLEIAQNITDGNFEQRIAGLEAEKQKEIDLAGNNAAARTRIEDEFNKKIATQKNKQAKADRDFALFNVAINTGQGIAKTIAQFGMPFAIPFIALVALQGALQAAVILSRPLPKYKKGRKGGPAEMAVVDEGGPELIIDKSGRIRELGGDQGPRTTFLPEGSKVVTADETKKMLREMEVQNVIRELGLSGSLSASIRQGRREEMAGVMAMAMQSGGIDQYALEAAFERAIKKVPKSDFYLDERGFRKRTREANQTTTYLNAISKL